MNLYYLENYIEVVKLGSISKAAQKLFLSQPAVSFQIRKLERELGFCLIDRDRNKFTVTREGKRFFRFAEYVYQEHKHLMYDLTLMQQGITGKLNILSSPIIGEFLLPSLLSGFKERNPSIDINLELVESQDVISLVSQGMHLVGFCGVSPKQANLESFKIGEDEMVLIVYPGHPFCSQKEIAVSDLIGESLILRADPAESRLMFKDELIKHGLDIDNYQPKLILGTASGLVSAVESKSGIALISSLAIKNSEAVGLVKVVKIKNLKLKRELYCIYRKEGPPDSLNLRFLDFIREKTGLK